MDRLTRHLYKAMGIMKDETGYQASFDDIAGLQSDKGLEGHWTDPNIDIMEYHQAAVKSRAVPDTPEYWDRLRSKLSDHVQNKWDSDEGLNEFEWEVAARGGLGDDDMANHLQNRVVNSNRTFKENPREWNKRFKDQGLSLIHI